MSQVVWIYAIRLDDKVLAKTEFLNRNPGYVPGRPCYYVGSSIYEPQTRLGMHENGNKASRWVKRYGKYVATRKCYQVQVNSAAERDASERARAEELPAQGYGVWQN